MMLKNFRGLRSTQALAPAIAPMVALIPSLLLGLPSVAAEQIISLTPDTLPRSVMGNAGGQTPIPGAIVPPGQGTPSASCLGFASHSADHQFQLDGSPDQLTFTVDSFDPAIDTTLVVQTPDGQWLCGDDLSPTNKDATVTINDPDPGRYQVWVGTFDGSYGEYELKLD